MTVRTLIKKPPVPTKRATAILHKVQACSALLRVLVVSIRSYRKSVLRYTFLILDIRRLDALYLCEQGCEDPWLFVETKWGRLVKTFVKSCSKCCSIVWWKEREIFTEDIKAKLQHGVIMRSVLVGCAPVQCVGGARTVNYRHGVTCHCSPVSAMWWCGW